MPYHSLTISPRRRHEERAPRLYYSRVLLALVIVAAFTARAARAEPPTGAAAARDPSRAALEAEAEDPASSADSAAAALYRLGELDEDGLHYARALDEYQRSFARSPSSRYAPRDVTHADYLRARSEGGFEPLARLDAVRHDPARADDPAQIDLLAHDLESFPPGLVRADARLVVAEAYSGRFNRPRDGIVELEKALDEPKIDALEARAAAHEVVEQLLLLGDIDGAIAEAHAEKSRLDPKYIRKVERRRLRRTLHRVALGDIAALVVLAGAAIALAKRRGRADAVVAALKRGLPITLLFVAYVAVCGGFLASKYETGNSGPFLVFGAALFPILLVARAWSAAGSSAAGARAGRAILCAASAVAAAFFILERLNPAYLDGFGL